MAMVHPPTSRCISHPAAARQQCQQAGAGLALVAWLLLPSRAVIGWRGPHNNSAASAGLACISCCLGVLSRRFGAKRACPAVLLLYDVPQSLLWVRCVSHPPIPRHPRRCGAAVCPVSMHGPPAYAGAWCAPHGRLVACCKRYHVAGSARVVHGGIIFLWAVRGMIGR